MVGVGEGVGGHRSQRGPGNELPWVYLEQRHKRGFLAEFWHAFLYSTGRKYVTLFTVCLP